MRQQDVLFLHAPRVFKGFWSKMTEKAEQKLRPQFCFLPMGLFSLAADLDTQGYAVKIVNLGIEQDRSRFFDFKRYIRSVDAKIFAIDLQWALSSSGALALAQACKRFHPNSLVVLGGMTATWFHEEILKTYQFVDAILRGETDASLPQLVHAVSTGKGLEEVDGLSYRHGTQIAQTPTGKLLPDLDSIDPTRLDLLEHCEQYLYGGVYRCGNLDSNDAASSERTFWYPISRGCPYNCAHCGGGHHAYRSITGRDRIALRAPEKVAEDLQVLHDKGIQRVKFSHDVEIGGEDYATDLLRAVRDRHLDLAAYVEVFRLPSSRFSRDFARTFRDPTFALSPESPHEAVRRVIGRDFSTHQFFKALDDLRSHGINAHVFFTVGLPGEAPHPDPGWARWLTSFTTFVEDVIAHGGVPLPPTIYTIDPNCPMAVNREQYGVKLLLEAFADYVKASASTEDLTWIGHETASLTQIDIGVLTSVAAMTVHSAWTRMALSKK